MKLTAIAILKSNGAEKTPTILGLAAELSNFGYFQRGPVKEMITFVTRTIVQRTQLGQRQTVKHEDYFCHVHVRESGLAGIVLVDRDYPVTASFSIISKVLDEFQAQEGSKWEAVQADSTVANVILEPAVLKYQDHTAADKIAKIQRDLDETKVVLHDTIDSILKRGEKLDSLVDKSNDLSLASQMFYKQARKTNSCCVLM